MTYRKDAETKLIRVRHYISFGDPDESHVNASEIKEALSHVPDNTRLEGIMGPNDRSRNDWELEFLEEIKDNSTPFTKQME